MSTRIDPCPSSPRATVPADIAKLVGREILHDNGDPMDAMPSGDYSPFADVSLQRAIGDVSGYRSVADAVHAAKHLRAENVAVLQADDGRHYLMKTSAALEGHDYVRVARRLEAFVSYGDVRRF